MERYMEQEHVKRFRDRLVEDEKSAATVQKYVRDIEGFLRFAEGKCVTKELAICYKQHLMERYKLSSVNSMLASLNRFFKEMQWFDCVVKALKIQRQAFRPSSRELTREEYYRLLETAKEENKLRLYLLMQTICATGIRVSELQFITVQAIQAGRAVVSLKGKTRTVLLPSALCSQLKSYVRSLDRREGSVFVTRSGRPLDRSNILHDMKGLCERAGVAPSKVFPHNLRHLFACLFYQAEKDISRLADLLGHSNINTTRIYVSVSGEEQVRQIEKLRLVVEKGIPHNIHYAVNGSTHMPPNLQKIHKKILN